jgi:molybdopterin adenylyltransferase
MSESSASHQEHARGTSVGCAVLTVSDTRTFENDEGGAMIDSLLREGGYVVRDLAIVRDDPPAIRARLESWLDQPDIDAILITGGTGIARRDTTVEVVRSFLTAELEGFGELFRMLSWQEVGAAAMLSRAVGGLAARDAHDTFIFAMPGSPNAVRTAMTKLVLPQLRHLVWERRR